MPSARPPLVLASASPRRRELLSAAGYAFRVVPPSAAAECGVCSGETPPQLVARLARQKAEDVRRRALEGPHRAEEIVVACDTVAECRGQILGKPDDEQHARQMLEQLSGQEHRVFSGLCLWPLASAEPLCRAAVTTLRMDALSSEQIEEYVAGGGWAGKAGGFGYQDRTGWLHVIEGSESNVVGLPMELLAEMLAELGGR